MDVRQYLLLSKLIQRTMAAAAGVKATHDVIRLDCKNLRSERQRLNNLTVFELIQAKKYKELKA